VPSEYPISLIVVKSQPDGQLTLQFTLQVLAHNEVGKGDGNRLGAALFCENLVRISKDVQKHNKL
jgi:hypothetical protein